MKPLTAEEKKTLEQLEEALWKEKTRFDPSFQEKTFAPDFFEFGRSGRRYSRAEMIRTEVSTIRANFPLKDFKIHQINDDTVLITYVSEVQYEELERANRSSLWTRSAANGDWQLRFHQGTATD